MGSEPWWKPFYPYMKVLADRPVVVDEGVELEIRSSTMGTQFISGRGRGLFTKHALPKQTVIAHMDFFGEHPMNDGMADITPILQAKTSTETYDAWTAFYQTYYDVDRAKSMVNVRMIQHPDSPDIYYETITDIPAGGELLRMYGFTTWIFEIPETIANRTIAGFVKFIHELRPTLNGDPLQYRIETLYSRLIHFVPDLAHIDLAYIDHMYGHAPALQIPVCNDI